jgi:putative membrane protein
MWWRGCGFGWGGGLFMAPFMILFWILVVALFARLFHRHGGHCSYGPHDFYGPAGEDPREIARRRYAKGELTKEQFEEIMKNLG